MKTWTRPLAGLSFATLAALLTLGACDTSSDSSYEPSRDCAITAVRASWRM